MARPVRIANCSGFYGDRASAAREMVEGGPIDVLTGDWLAELTMLVLAKASAREGGVGWARTFLVQLEEVLGRCLDDGVRVVSNAGGLDPAGCAAAVEALASRLGLDVAVAHVVGDDLRGATAAVEPPVTGEVVTANAYLGGWGIARALAAGADVVVTGRTTDASLVVGPAAWWHGWQVDDWDALAGAVVAGHVVECGPQATGGNHPFLADVVDRRAPGFPLAEVHADGSSTITKHPGTGGLVDVDTVTGQLLYELGPAAYANPDVTAHFDTVRLAQDGADRVRVTGTRGSPPPATLKVAVTEHGGYRSSITLGITGLDVEAKAAWAEQLLRDRLGDDGPDALELQLLRLDVPDAPTNAQATAHLRITATASDRRRAGRAFQQAVVEQALGSYAGLHALAPPGDASALGVFTPAAVPRDVVAHVVVLPDGTREGVPDPPVADGPAAEGTTAGGTTPPDEEGEGGSTVAVPLGRLVGARSGDKGGDANVGLWARDDATHAWLRRHLTVERIRDLLGPEAADLAIDRHELPHLRALNVVVHGLLGDGVASSTRPDPQAKGLGEYLRSRVVDAPAALVGTAGSQPPGTPSRTSRK